MILETVLNKCKQVQPVNTEHFDKEFPCRSIEKKTEIHVNPEPFVFQVCDEPHPMLIQDMLQHCVNGNVEEAYKTMAHLWKLGYSADDIITIIFRVCKNQNIPEFLKLEFIKV